MKATHIHSLFNAHKHCLHCFSARFTQDCKSGNSTDVAKEFCDLYRNCEHFRHLNWIFKMT